MDTTCPSTSTKKTEYVPVESPPTSEIFAQLRELESEIQKGMEELEGMV